MSEPDRLVAETTLDPAAEPFLMHHVLYSNNVSDIDPTLDALPVQPIAVSVEVALEAATALTGEVPNAVEKSVKDARKQIMRVLRVGTTIPHQTEGVFGASRVRLIPAAPGTGIIAGKSVRKVLELAGISDILTKNYGSTNSLNVVKATMAALAKLRSKESVAALRGVEVQ